MLAYIWHYCVNQHQRETATDMIMKMFMIGLHILTNLTAKNYGSVLSTSSFVETTIYPHDEDPTITSMVKDIAPISTTVFVPYPDDVPESGNFKLVWTTENYIIRSALTRGDIKESTRTYYLQDPCGFAVLAVKPMYEVKILKELLRGKQTYNASVTWYKYGYNCVRPIYKREYGQCSPRAPFGSCPVRSVVYWDSEYYGFSYIGSNELDLIMVAPDRETSGLYLVMVVINDDVVTVDVYLEVNRLGKCWYSKISTPSDNIKRCITFKRFRNENINVNSIGMKIDTNKENHKNLILHYVKSHGGTVPTLISSRLMKRGYDLPQNFWETYITFRKGGEIINYANFSDVIEPTDASIEIPNISYPTMGSTSIPKITHIDMNTQAVTKSNLYTSKFTNVFTSTVTPFNINSQLSAATIGAIVIFGTIVITAFVGISTWFILIIRNKSFNADYISNKPSRRSYVAVDTINYE